MDKQEYREIVSDIRDAYDNGQYDQVLMFADELEMKKVSDSRVLEMVADAHAAGGDLETARDMMLKAYEKTPMGRKLAYKLSELSLEMNDLDGAVEFYEDFCKMSPHDNDKYLLKYKIGKTGNIAKEDLAKVLAVYCSKEVDERWMAELAGLYDELGETEKCNEICDDIILWFADGKYVGKALELKNKNGGLTSSQQARLDQMKKESEEEGGTYDMSYDPYEEGRDLQPGNVATDSVPDDDLDSILEEYITIEDATAPPEPVRTEDIAEVLPEAAEEVPAAVSNPENEMIQETEVIPIDKIREAESNWDVEDEAAQARAEQKGKIVQVQMEPDVVDQETTNLKEPVFREPEYHPGELTASISELTDEILAEMGQEPRVSYAQVQAETMEPVQAAAEPVVYEEEPVQTAAEPEVYETEPVQTTAEPVMYEPEPEQTAAEPEMYVPEPEQAVQEEAYVPEPQDDASAQEEAAEAPAEVPIITAAENAARPFSNIEAMQSARTAPPKDENNFWKMPENLVLEEEPVLEEFQEPVYGSHRWFEEKPQPDPDYAEPVFGAHRYGAQPEVEVVPEPEEEYYVNDVMIEQVEPEPFVIEQAEEEEAVPEHISTIKTTSSGAEFLGMYAAAKNETGAERLSDQAVLVRKPALGTKRRYQDSQAAETVSGTEEAVIPEPVLSPKVIVIPEPADSLEPEKIPENAVESIPESAEEIIPESTAEEVPENAAEETVESVSDETAEPVEESVPENVSEEIPKSTEQEEIDRLTETVSFEKFMAEFDAMEEAEAEELGTPAETYEFEQKEDTSIDDSEIEEILDENESFASTVRIPLKDIQAIDAAGSELFDELFPEEEQKQQASGAPEITQSFDDYEKEILVAEPYGKKAEEKSIPGLAQSVAELMDEDAQEDAPEENQEEVPEEIQEETQEEIQEDVPDEAEADFERAVREFDEAQKQAGELEKTEEAAAEAEPEVTEEAPEAAEEIADEAPAAEVEPEAAEEPAEETGSEENTEEEIAAEAEETPEAEAPEEETAETETEAVPEVVEEEPEETEEETEEEEEDEEDEEDLTPPPFMFRVMPHDHVEEVVPDVVKERIAKAEAEKEAAAKAEAEKAEAERAAAEKAAAEKAEAERAAAEKAAAEKAEAERAEAEKAAAEKAAALKAAMLAAAALTATVPKAEETKETEDAEPAESEQSVSEPEDAVQTEAAPEEDDFLEAELQIPEEKLQEEPVDDLMEEAAPAEDFVPEELEEEIAEYPEAFPEAADIQQEAGMDLPEPEAEPSVFIPLEQLGITPAAEYEEEIAEETAVFEEAPFDFEEGQTDDDTNEFERAVQDFELSHRTDEENWDEEFGLAEPETLEAPIEEITASLPKMEVPAAEEAAETSFEAAEEAEAELSDFEKAMLAFDAGGSDQEDDFNPDELGDSLNDFIDEPEAPWEEPEFGLPDFETSEFAQPEFLGSKYAEQEAGATVELDVPELQPEELEEPEQTEEPEPEMPEEAAPDMFLAEENIYEEPEYDREAEEAFAAAAAAEPEMIIDEETETASGADYVIPDDLRDELYEFLLIDGMEERISSTISSLIERKRAGDPTGGHLIVTGDAKSGKTYLTISIIKAVGKEIGSTNGRVAKVQASSLNGKDMSKVFGKISGSDLIIENAGYLNEETVENLIRIMKGDKFSAMVVLEGNQLGIENIMTKAPELGKLFHTRMDLDELSLSEWANLACEYAEERGYHVGDMALLALHAKIDEMNLPTTRLVVDDVKGIIDKAIEKAEKRSSGRFLFGGKKGRASAQELDETDFM